MSLEQTLPGHPRISGEKGKKGLAIFEMVSIFNVLFGSCHGPSRRPNRGRGRFFDRLKLRRILMREARGLRLRAPDGHAPDTRHKEEGRMWKSGFKAGAFSQCFNVKLNRVKPLSGKFSG